MDVPCPICRHNVWSIGTEYVLLQSVKDDLDVEVGRGYLAYQLRCNTCGFHRLHATEVLDALAPDGSPEGEGGTSDAQDPGDEASETVEHG
jgi:hypothetical protein